MIILYIFFNSESFRLLINIVEIRQIKSKISTFLQLNYQYNINIENLKISFVSFKTKSLIDVTDEIEKFQNESQLKDFVSKRRSIHMVINISIVINKNLPTNVKKHFIIDDEIFDSILSSLSNVNQNIPAGFLYKTTIRMTDFPSIKYLSKLNSNNFYSISKNINDNSLEEALHNLIDNIVANPIDNPIDNSITETANVNSYDDIIILKKSEENLDFFDLNDAKLNLTSEDIEYYAKLEEKFSQKSSLQIEETIIV